MTARILLPAILISILSFLALAQDTLYHRLGGREGIQPMVGDFVDMVIRDPRIRRNSDAKKFLDRAKPSDLKTLLWETLCQASEGPCKGDQAGAALGNAVRAMQLTPTDWGAIDGDFSAAMVKFKVSSPDQKDLRVLMDRARASL